MDDTPNLKLPYIMAAQSQKHVTHNEAIRALDAIVQLSVADRDLGVPPASPSEGDRYVVAAAPVGAWAGHAGNIAAWQDGAWAFYAPEEGWIAWVADEDRLVAWDGTAWVVAGGGLINPAPLVGVNATADATNRLSVKSNAALFSHDDVTPGTGDLRVVYNKAAAGNTASFLYQTGFSGRAEVGLTGDDKLHFKVSADGATWKEALCIDQATGFVGIGTTAAGAPLNVVGADTVRLERHAGSHGGGAAQFQIRRSNGTQPTPSAVVNGDSFGNFTFQPFDGTNYLNAGRLRVDVDGAVSTGIVPTKMMFMTMNASGAFASRWEVKPDGTWFPAGDNAYDIGTGSFRVQDIFLVNAPTVSSDARGKDVIGPIGFAAQMIDAVEPRLYRLKEGRAEQVPSATGMVLDDDGETMVPRLETVTRPGRRLHAGFLAQEVKAAMDASGTDFAAWGLADKDDPESRQWVRVEELVAVLWAALRETRAELMGLVKLVNKLSRS